MARIECLHLVQFYGAAVAPRLTHSGLNPGPCFSLPDVFPLQLTIRLSQTTLRGIRPSMGMIFRTIRSLIMEKLPRTSQESLSGVVGLFQKLLLTIFPWISLEVVALVLRARLILARAHVLFVAHKLQVGVRADVTAMYPMYTREVATSKINRV